MKITGQHFLIAEFGSFEAATTDPTSDQVYSGGRLERILRYRCCSILNTLDYFAYMCCRAAAPEKGKEEIGPSYHPTKQELISMSWGKVELLHGQY